MKKTSKHLFAVLLCGLLLTAPLTSCSETDKQNSTSADTFSSTLSSASSTSTSSSSGTADTDNDIEKDSYEEQITYYMELTEALQAELIQLKEESYIEECQYQLQINTLEETVKQLQNAISVLNNGSQTPTGGTQNPTDDQLAIKLDYKYTENNGKLTITEYTGSALEISIPQSINGMKVVAIGEAAFKGQQIRSVTLPEGLETIGWFAFSGCTVLESITIPSSVMSVGYGAFDYCPKSLKIYCTKGSYIEAYALSWGISVSAN